MATKNKIYGQQRTFLLLFLVLFTGVNAWFAENLYMSLLQGVCSILLGYYTGKAASDRNLATDLVLLSTAILLPVVFSVWVGNDTPIWLFSMVTVFQCICLISNRKLRYFYITLCIASGIGCSLIQNSPESYIAGQAAILIVFSFISEQTIVYLIRAQEALQRSFNETLKMGQEMEETRSFQRRLLDGTHYALIATDTAGIITEFNQSASQLLGYTADELTGRQTPLLFFDEHELAEKTAELNARYHAGITPGFQTIVYRSRIGLPNNSEWIFCTRQGSSVRVMFSVSLLKDRNGKTTGYIGIAEDITEKRRLEEQQHTAEAIIANSPSVLLKWKPDRWTIQYVSANIIHLLGYHSIDFTNGKIRYVNLILAEDLPAVLAQTTHKLNSGADKLNIEYRMKHCKGEVIWVEQQAFVKRNEQGGVEYLEGIITDITKKKKVEEELKASDLRYVLAAKGTAAGLWDWFDLSSNRQWWSPRFYELLGYTEDEMPACLESFRKILHPEDREHMLAELDNHFRNDAPFNIEYRLKTKSGGFKWFQGTGQAHRNEKGEPVRMVGSIIDIDHKKNNETLLKKSEERFRLLIESARDIFYNTDENGRFTYANEVAVAITGYEMSEIIGMKYIDLIREDYRTRAGMFYTNQVRNKIELTYFEFPIRTKFGQLKWIGQNVQMLYEDGVFRGIQAVARDITDLRLAQQQLHEYTRTLERANKELDEFAHAVSHDLRAPLKGMADLAGQIRLRQESWLTHETRNDFQLLINRLHRMEHFINGLLQYSRVGRKKTKTEHINVRELVHELIRSLPIPGRFEVTEDVEDITLETDAASLSQVLRHLISNAVNHHNNINPRISVQCMRQESKLVFSVNDNGPGIESRHHARIFKLLQTIGPQDHTQHTGIGLAIARKILERRKEAIVLESEPGKGSKFSFTWSIT